MAIESDLKTFLAAIEAVAGAGMAAKVFPVFAPEKTAAPYLVYRRLPGTQRAYASRGQVAAVTAVFRITAWAAGYEDAAALATALRIAMNGPWPKDAAPGITLMKVEDESDAFEPSPELLQYQFFGRRLDVSVKYVEAVA